MNKKILIFCVILFLGFASALTSRYQEKKAAGIWAFDFEHILYEKSGELKNIEQLTQDLEADNPYVVGLAPRFSWGRLNPDKGSFDWEPIDRVIKVAEANNKLMLIRIAGHLSPKWLWQEGAQYIEVKKKKKEGRLEKVGLLWDKKFQDAWFSFMKALCNRYKDNHIVQRISIDDGVGNDEMYYIRDDLLGKGGIEKIKKLGFSEEKVIDFWKKNIDNVYENVGKKPVFMNLSRVIVIQPLRGDDPVEKEVVNYALKKFGNQLYLQQNGLSQRTVYSRKCLNHRFMIDYAKTNVIGFQTLSPENHGDLMTTFKNGLKYPISYVEIFIADLRNPENRPAIEFLYAHLMERKKVQDEKENRRIDE